MSIPVASLDDFGNVPIPEEELAGYVQPEFVPLTAFAQTEEQTGTPLIGSEDEPLLPVGGILLMYGDGGAGKTTLSLDAVAHLGAGIPWLGIAVTAAVKITLIENEGPRGQFRRKVAAKVAGWNGHAPFADNVTILEEPWTRFTLRDARHRNALAEHVNQTSSDLVVLGPLTTLGMIGGGTPDEVLAFENLLAETRELVAHPFAWWIVHHENKAGDVSGAWERVPDVLVHVQARGNGHTHVVWRKARWSGALHGKSVDLTWEDGAAYGLRSPDEDRDLHAELVIALTDTPEWFTLKEIARLIEANEQRSRMALTDLVERGEVEYAVGPAGRHGSAKCWRIGGSEQLTLSSYKGAPGHSAHLDAPSDKGALAHPGAPDAPSVSPERLEQGAPGAFLVEESNPPAHLRRSGEKVRRDAGAPSPEFDSEW